MKNKVFIKGALILIICNLIGKILGAVYRIPLARIIGGVGMGQYQLVFPLYCLILTVSTSGIPASISKLVAEYNTQNRFKDSKKLLRISILILTIVSLVGAVLVVLNARFISGMQGNQDAYICYYGIAPAIVFVGVLSAFRGYFQGNLLMFPTAISNLVEQVFKMVIGLILANKFSIYGVQYAVLGALIGISISELFAFLFLFICYLFYARKHYAKKQIVGTYSYKFLSKQLFNLAVPITLGGLISPITSMVDSFLVVNLLMFSGLSSEMSTMMLGIQAGVVEPLLNLPVIISVSISMVLLPSLSGLSGKGAKDEIKVMIEKAYQIALSISIACTICFIIFGSQLLSFLYGGSFDVNEITLAMKLLMLGSVNIVFISLVQITSSVLQGLNHTKYPVKTLLIGCGLKIALNVALMLNPSINIFGAVVSGFVCYFIVFLLNYMKIKKLTEATISKSYFYVSIQACFVCMFAFFSNYLLQMVLSDTVALFASGILAVCIFAITYYAFFMGEQDSQQEPQEVSILDKKVN